MPPFPKPRFAYPVDVDGEIAALRAYRDGAPGRQVPPRRDGNVLVATWNIANLGLQQRTDEDHRLIAEIIGWFDLATVQEVNHNLAGIQAVHSHLPDHYRLLFSDASGNDERQAFLFDTTRVTQLEEIGRLSIPPAQLKRIKLPGATSSFTGFDRGPYLGTFQAGAFQFMLASVHLYYGSDRPAGVERRVLETYALAWWARKYHLDKDTYVPDVIALGDCNLPKVDPGDPVYAALTSRGLKIPEHSSQVASAIATDSQYDQIAFFPGEAERRFTGQMSVFDFDGALFADLYRRSRKDFLAWTRYHLSDHRPLWAEFTTT